MRTKILIFIIIGFLGFGNKVSAYDFYVSPFAYDILSEEDKTVAIYSTPEVDKIKDVIVPATVEYEGIEYTVSEIGCFAFQGYRHIQSITIPETIKRLGDYAFLLMDGLENFTSLATVPPLGKLRVSHVEMGHGGDNEVTSTINVFVPEESIQLYDNDNGWNSHYIYPIGFKYADGFYSDKLSYKVIQYAEKLTEVRGDDKLNLDKVIIPDYIEIEGDRFKIVSIAEEGFCRFKKLYEVQLPSTLERISDDAFSFTEISSIVLPASIRYIGIAAFEYCQALKSVYCLATTPPVVNAAAFDHDVIMYVPENSLADYLESDWRRYNLKGRDMSGVETVIQDATNPEIKLLDNQLYLAGNENNVLIRIYSASGALVLSPPSSEEPIDISNLPAGVYIVKAGDFSGKFVR